MTDTAHTTLPTAAKHARRPVMPMSMSPGMLLLRGLVAAGVAVLAGLAITYLVRVMLNADAFQSAGSVNGAGFPNSGALSAGIAIATLLAVVVLEMLGRVTPRPFTAFAAIMALGYLAFFGVSATSGLAASQIAGQLLVALPLAVVIMALASLATGIQPDAP
jgi:hypothetical protein